MRKLASAVVMLTLIALPAHALSTKDILSLVAMPLAVAAVSNVTGMPQDELGMVVSRLNQANVPPAEFVQVVRYVPVALVVDTPQQPTFVQFVDQQTSQGITGPALVTAIDNHLVTTYDVRPVIVQQPPDSLLLVGNDYVPEAVLTRLDTGSMNPLALALMPLAVAAVADISGVPQNELANFVATLNNANVPPLQFIQVMRYVPVALVSDSAPQFVGYVQSQVAQGLTGPALVTIINQQLPSYGVPQSEITVSAPQPRTLPAIDDTYFPRVVQQQVAIARNNPHGGPPGQLKKQLSLQTGAEVVHGYQPGRPMAPTVATTPVIPRGEEAMGRGHTRGRELPRPMISSTPEPRGHGNGRAHGTPPGQMRKMAPRVVAQPTTVAAPAPRQIPPGQAKKQRGNETVRGYEGNRTPRMPATVAPPAQGAMPPGKAKKQGGGDNGQGAGKGHGKG